MTEEEKRLQEEEIERKLEEERKIREEEDRIRKEKEQQMRVLFMCRRENAFIFANIVFLKAGNRFINTEIYFQEEYMRLIREEEDRIRKREEMFKVPVSHILPSCSCLAAA